MTHNGREPFKGEKMVCSGLFDIPFQGQVVTFLGEGKRGVWRCEMSDGESIPEVVECTPIHFLRDWEISDTSLKEYNDKMREKDVESAGEWCCDKYTSKFCPECGAKI